ncbi:hypothetical protein C2E23DRAFT_862515 [Lenzites betulinus]|nr:hypothetical protein C2E23DRAFT_862515 [Lenzites betulinus]
MPPHKLGPLPRPKPVLADVAVAAPVVPVPVPAPAIPVPVPAPAPVPVPAPQLPLAPQVLAVETVEDAEDVRPRHSKKGNSGLLDRHPTDPSAHDPRVHRRDRKRLAKLIESMEVDMKTKRASKSINKYHQQARHLARVVHPFMSPFQALSYGLLHDGCGSDSSSESSSDSSDDDEGLQDDALKAAQVKRTQKARERELVYQYRGILDFIPGLDTDLELLHEDELITLTDYLKHNIKNARSNDSGRIMEHVMTYMQDSDLSIVNKEYERAPGATLEKYSRGWHNWHTARLVCPQAKLIAFDVDWQSFADKVMQSAISIGGGDYPAFLYDQQAVDPDDELAGLLHSQYFVMCFRSLWTGPASARLTYGRTERMPGKPPIAFAYQVFEVSPRMIAYTAVLVRAALSSQTQFCEQDSGFYNACDLFDHIVELFEDANSEWSQQTLAWWNKRVFGRMSHMHISADLPQDETTADRLRKVRRATRKAARATAHAASTGYNSSYISLWQVHSP